MNKKGTSFLRRSSWKGAYGVRSERDVNNGSTGGRNKKR